MTVKDALHSFVDELSDDEAESALEVLSAAFGTSVRIVPVSPEERESIRKGLEELNAGKGVPHEEALQRLRYRA